jgi:tetratricopeptide (TPR) repeat protein
MGDVVHRSRRFGAWALLLALVSLLFAVGPAAAKKDKKKTTHTVSRAVAKQLTPALEALKNEQYAEAEERLKKLEGRADRIKPYERALVYQMLGYLESGQERLPAALVYFEKCLAENALPPHAQIQTRFNVAQLYLATEQFPEAVKTLETWFQEAENPTPNAYYMLAVARYQNQDIEGAIEPAETAVRIAETVREPWLQLLVGLYYETEEFAKAQQPLEALIMLNPRKAYWTQLSSLYAHLGMEPRSLAVMQLAYGLGFLENDRELRQLAQLYLYHSIPYRAAEVLQKGLDDKIVAEEADVFAMLANSLLLAREYDEALSPLRRAAVLSSEGNLYARLGQVLLDREHWVEAGRAMSAAIEKGELHDAGSANLMLGIALYHQKRAPKARRYFSAALEHSTSRESAEKWILLLDRESQGS